MAALPLCRGGFHDKLTLVGDIAVAVRPVGGSGTVCNACTCEPYEKKRTLVTDITTINTNSFRNSIFLMLHFLANSNTEITTPLLFLEIADKSYGRVFLN